MEIRVRNVPQALAVGVRTMKAGIDGQGPSVVSPRGQPTLEWYEPVLTIIEHPRERVLFSETRDANPFFHFFEALWMLAGRNDVWFVEQLNRRMREFSDDGTKFFGAYGYRWRNYFGFDQIHLIIQQLWQDPASRRAVLSMWTAPDLKFTVPYDGRHGVSKDIPCNTHVYFKARDGNLRMTVCNRSNDMLWGAYGSNAVHFSMLQEYIADKLGLEVGALHILSDSLHVYTAGSGGDLWNRVSDPRVATDIGRDLYQKGELGEHAVRPLRMCAWDKDWDEDLKHFFECVDSGDLCKYSTPWFEYVVAPMWETWKTRDMSICAEIEASDWRTACSEWLTRRM